MLVQNAKQTKRSKILTVVAIVLFVVTAVAIYFVYFTEPDIDLVNADQAVRLNQIDTDFPTEILESKELQSLKLIGPTEVKVQLRGRTSDPFEAF